ncbi:MAG: hypothetical protein HYY93_06275 [Planctomycetes bacterium]|nr:hypothetical protein [Planctomycetota bacterium]
MFPLPRSVLGEGPPPCGGAELKDALSVHPERKPRISRISAFVAAAVVAVVVVVVVVVAVVHPFVKFVKFVVHSVPGSHPVEDASPG